MTRFLMKIYRSSDLNVRKVTDLMDSDPSNPLLMGLGCKILLLSFDSVSSLTLTPKTSCARLTWSFCLHSQDWTFVS